MAQVKQLESSKIRRSSTSVIITLLVGSFLMAIATRYFIISIGLYTPGLAGIANGISYTIWDILVKNGNDANIAIAEEQFKIAIYWIVYAIANIPIIYLTLRWYSMRFFKLSIFVFVANLAFTMFLTFTPGFADASFIGGHDPNGNVFVTTTGKIVLGTIGGLFYGVGVGMIFRVGACTMGLDPVMRYFSREKNRSIAPLLFWVAIINMMIWINISYFINPNGIDQNWTSYVHNTLFAPEFIASIIFIASYSLTAGYLYSTDKKLKVEVTTSKGKEISDHFNSIEYHRSHSISEIKGGYSKKTFSNVSIIVNNEEIYDVVEMIAAADPQSFILVTDLKRVYDIHDWRPKTKEDKDHAEKIKASKNKRKNKNKDTKKQ